MNNRRGRLYLKTPQILLDSRCSSTVVMGRLVEKRKLDKYSVIQWRTQARNITTNLRVKVYSTLPALIATNVVTWKFNVDDSSKGKYYMILGRAILTELVLNLTLDLFQPKMSCSLLFSGM